MLKLIQRLINYNILLFVDEEITKTKVLFRKYNFKLGENYIFSSIPNFILFSNFCLNYYLKFIILIIIAFTFNYNIVDVYF